METESHVVSSGSQQVVSESLSSEAITNGDNHMEVQPPEDHILLVEPFYGGSHKQLVDLLLGKVQGCVKVTLPAKKWHWRARTGALALSQTIQHSSHYKVLFCSSVLNLAELVALRPDLARLHKVLYFHENQLVYPVRKQQERDFQYGYNQILSCLVADVVVFNSNYNQSSFLDSIGPFIKLIPDHRPRHLADKIRPKCRVLNFPICFPVKGQYDDLDIAATSEKQLSQDSDKKKLSINESDVSKKSESTNHENTNGVLLPDQKGDSKSSTTPNTAVATTDQVVKRRPTCLGDPSGNNSAKLERRSMCFSPSEPLGLQLMSPLDGELEGLMGRGRDFMMSTTNMRRSETEPSNLIGGNLPSALDLSPTSSTCKSLIDVSAAAVESQVKVEVKPKPRGQEVRDEEGSKRIEESKDVKPLHIVWPHRWEHDKDPETFFRVLTQLHDDGCSFKVSVLGETFTDIPAVFAESKEKLSEHILNWGYLPSKADFYRVLEAADVVVSTAKHEFFGVGMLEAAYLGCYPLCPNDLVYPEIFPHECLYNTTTQLTKTLRQFCKRPLLVQNRATRLNVERYSWNTLAREYQELLSCPT